MIGSPSTDLTSKFALDTKGLGELRQSAKAGTPAALKEAATQFEAMFINMMMKSMRDATPQEGMLDNQQSKMFTSMLDQQMSQNLAKRGMGLADVLTRQLSANQLGAHALALGADGAASVLAPAMAPGAGGMRPGMDAATMIRTGAVQPDNAPSSGARMAAPASSRLWTSAMAAISPSLSSTPI